MADIKNPSAPNVNPDITLASGQKISGTDPNYAEYAKQAQAPSTNIAQPAAVVEQTQPGALNKDGLTMEQANDPKYWSNGKYVGPSNITTMPTPTPTATTPTTSTTPTSPTAQDPSTKVDTLLQQGYSDPALIASASGMTVDEVNNYLNSNEDASYKLSVNKNTNQQDQAYNTYKSAMDQITNGTFALTATEQANINAIQAQFDKMKQDQINANANYEGATQTAEIRSGRQEFMNQISGGIYKQAVDDGLKKVQQIESDAVAKITEYKQAIQDKNYKAADAAYTATQKYLADKSTAIKELHDATMEEYQRQQDAIKAANDQITQNLTNTSLLLENNQKVVDTLIPGLASLLTNDSAANEQLIQSIADSYGIDPNILYSSAQKYITANVSSAGNSFINKVTGEIINVPGSAKPIEIGTDSTGNKRYGIFDEKTNSIVEIKNPTGATPTTGLALPEYQDFISDKSPEVQALFNGMDDTTKTNVMSLVSGDVLLGDLAKGMGGAAAAQRYNALAKQIDPTYSEAVNKSRNNFIKKWDDPSGKPNAQRVAINTALGHLAELKSVSDTLGNAILLPYNKLVNYLKENTGNPNVTNFNTVVTALAGELASVYKSGAAPTDQETEQWRNNILSNLSQGQISGVVGITSNLISSKLTAMGEEYKKSMGKYPKDQIIDPFALEELKNKGINTSKLESSIQRQTTQTATGTTSNNLDDIWK